MTKLLWQPSESFRQQSNLRHYLDFLRDNRGLVFDDYEPLWQWSVQQPEALWSSLADYFRLQFHSPYEQVLRRTGQGFIGTRWFEGATLSYAEHIFRQRTPDRPAIIYQCEDEPVVRIGWDELERQVKAIRAALQANGVGIGDRVVAYLPNTPDAVVAFLAVNSLGAIWSCCSPDFGVDSVTDRFQQIEPKVFIAAATYRYNGKNFDRSDAIRTIRENLPTLRSTILIGADAEGFERWDDLLRCEIPGALEFTAVPFDHPIWILYSSGTTGKPKAITHSSGGNLIEHYKALALHQDVKPGECYLWYSTTGWMMWNYALSSLLVGATLCIYDGSPAYPDMQVLWDFVSREKIRHFGVGAAFYINCMKQGLDISSSHDLSALRTLGSTGSPLPPEGFRWIYAHVKSDAWLISLSGGTDVCSAFVGGNPFGAVYEGEIQCRMLGASVEAWNEAGKAVEQELGELVITQPMPSMPVYFWNDPGDERYRSSYFDVYPDVWRHGDWIKITEHNGVIIYGRSDATLNRDGVRIGTAEIYSAVESLPEVKDSLVICLERPNGEYYMPLFVVLKGDASLDDSVKQAIRNVLRTQYSPRHVPDAIFAVPEIPYTLSGKKMEMPVKKLFMGTPLEKAVSLDTMRNPACMEVYVDLAARHAF